MSETYGEHSEAAAGALLHLLQAEAPSNPDREIILTCRQAAHDSIVDRLSYLSAHRPEGRVAGGREGKLLSPARQRAAVNHLQRKLKMSERFACRVVGQPRSTHRHVPASQTVEDPDAALRTWLREYAGKHPRWGHRRAYHDARGEGWAVNHKKVQRLWREEALRVVVRKRRKRVGSSTTPPIPTAAGPNMVWAIDFQFDSTTDGRPVKILSVVDEHTRECLGGLVERSITADVLSAELNRIAFTRGASPAVLRLDNGPERIAAALAEWAGTKTGMLFIPPGEPWRNPFIESFNGRLRDECLNIHLFWVPATGGFQPGTSWS